MTLLLKDGGGASLQLGSDNSLHTWKQYQRH